MLLLFFSHGSPGVVCSVNFALFDEGILLLSAEPVAPVSCWKLELLLPSVLTRSPGTQGGSLGSSELAERLISLLESAGSGCVSV